MHIIVIIIATKCLKMVIINIFMATMALNMTIAIIMVNNIIMHYFINTPNIVLITLNIDNHQDDLDLNYQIFFIIIIHI